MKSLRSKALLCLLAIVAILIALMGVLGPARTLDKLPWYNASEAVKLLDDLGPEGRQLYLRNEWIDLAFILVYSGLAFLATGWIWKKRLSTSKVRLGQYLSLLPGVLDLTETSLVISAISSYPQDLPTKIAWLCLATPAKWFAALVLIASAFCGAVLNVRDCRSPL